jgi:hypothetical protein
VVTTAPTNWSGLYFGANAGYSWSNYENTYVTNNAFWETATDAPIAGGQIGLQHQFGNIVLGVEGLASTVFSPRDTATQCPNPATICSGVFSDVITIGPRLGVGLEYRHYELEDFTSERNFVGGGIDPGDRANVSTSLDTVSLRVSWKLGRPDTVVPLK